MLALAISIALGAATDTKPKICIPTYSGHVVAEWANDGRSMTLEKPLSFQDSHCITWSAPKGATVDGASIPSFLWSIVGGPFEGRYRDGSVIHDWYCDRRTVPWKAVHRMFYDAMIASGVGETRAKIMYAAVYYGGPRWSDITVTNNRLREKIKQTAVPAAVKTELAEVPPDPETDSKANVISSDFVSKGDIRSLASKIQKSNLTLEQIEARADDLRDQRTSSQ
jgi:hypothetical protein